MVLKIFSYSPYTNPNTVKSSPTKIAKDNGKNFHTTWNGSTSRCLLKIYLRDKIRPLQKNKWKIVLPKELTKLNVLNK